MTFFTEDIKRKSPEELGELLLQVLYNSPSDADETLAVKFIRAGAKPDVRTITEQTPLILAAQNGFTKAAHALIETGANTEDHDNGNCTALFWAALRGDRVILNALVESGAEINIRDFKNDTPLHFAAIRGHTAILRTLLELGGDIDAVGSRGTLEQTARAEGQEETARFVEGLRAERLRAAEAAQREKDAIADWRDQGMPLKEPIAVPKPLRLRASGRPSAGL